MRISRGDGGRQHCAIRGDDEWRSVSEQAASKGTVPQTSAVQVDRPYDVVDAWDPHFQADYDEEEPENKEAKDKFLEERDANDEEPALGKFIDF